MESFRNQYKRLLVILLVLCILSICIVLLIQNVSFGKGSGAHAAMSVALDKKSINSVDRVVIINATNEIEINDPTVIARIIEDTIVATHTKVTCPIDRQINLYCGDKLIRSMGWSRCCDTVNVYDTDIQHWVVSIEGLEEGGSIYLSPDLVDTLNTYID